MSNKNKRKQGLETSLYDVDKVSKFFSLWRLGIQGSGVTVALLDTGIDHVPRIRDRISIDKDFTNENNTRDWDTKHGTKTAKLVNDIAPKAKIANFKVIPKKGKLEREIVCNAIEYCIDDYPKYKIINLSLWFKSKGCPDKCKLCSIIREAVKKGIFITAAAGNKRSWFKNRKKNTMTCPGTATDAFTVDVILDKKMNEYWSMLTFFEKLRFSLDDFGTSFSSAQAAGFFALLISAFPERSVLEIRDAVVKTEVPTVPPQMNCEAAFRYLLGTKPYPPQIFDYTIDDYFEATSIIRDLGWNRIYQKNKNPQLIQAFETALSCIDFYQIKTSRFGEAIKSVEKMQPYLSSGLMPHYEKRAQDMIDYCQSQLE